jgi:omega-6 fatty acid desaturase (delta-12 desaturase)
LPETMKKIAELQNCKTTSLSPKSVSECFKLKVWDQESNRMTGVKGLS